jgi:hypothetical protein
MQVRVIVTCPYCDKEFEDVVDVDIEPRQL